MNLRAYLCTLVRWVIGGLFIFAGVLKVRDPWSFAESVESFALLPAGLIGPVVIALPAVEIVFGGMLLWRRFQSSAALGLGVLMLLFTLGIAQGLVRGLEMDCGCFGELDVLGKSAWTALGRDLVLLAGLGWIWFSEPPRLEASADESGVIKL